MIIRLAQPEDAPAMARVTVDTFLSAHRGQIPEAVWAKRKRYWTHAASERAWRRALQDIAGENGDRECIYVAEDETGELVGLAMGGPSDRKDLENTGMIGTLYVRESHQRQGVGRRLVRAAAGYLADIGMAALQIGVLKANAPARCFYEALGGQVVAEQAREDYGMLLPEVVYGWPDIMTLATAHGLEPGDGLSAQAITSDRERREPPRRPVH